ncbi:MAG: hypothetical protein IKN30_00285 [Synergistaceae bacterium]|nr:hypothetical protein [Synergistaceae bacterium]
MSNSSSGRIKTTSIYNADFSNSNKNFELLMKSRGEFNAFWTDKKNRVTKDKNIDDYSQVPKIKTYMDIVRIIAPYSVAKLNNLRSHIYKSDVKFSKPENKAQNVEGLAFSIFRGMSLYKQKMTSGFTYEKYNFDDTVFKSFLK